MTKSKQRNPRQSLIEVEEVGELSPHTKALYEAGKTLLVDSVTTSRDFSKFMISLCTGAIPVYLGLLKFVLPTDYSLDFWGEVLTVLPAAFFLLGSIIFTIAYFPQTDYFSLDIVEEIERAHRQALEKRGRLTKIGFAAFLLGNTLGILTIVLNLS